MEATKQKFRTLDLAYIALFAVLIAVCSWISIPLIVPFTMQTFGVVMAVAVLGGKRGTMAIIVYLLLGLVGLPVFAGFKGGPGALLGMTGGYLVGFLCSGLLMWAVEHFFGTGRLVSILSMILGLAVCYLFGTVWFVRVYTTSQGAITFGAALLKCVVPFLIPDLLKIALAQIVYPRVKKHLK